VNEFGMVDLLKIEQMDYSPVNLSGEFNVLSIDCEDWFQGLEIGIEEWDKFESRLEKNLLKLLSLLEETKTKATFFILGYVAEKFPHLVKVIAQEGHEIGNHGYSHQFVYKQSPSEFREEMQKSIELLERLSGQKVVSYRAPFFSITQSSLWALEILSDLGIVLDSSIFPVINYRYGIPQSPRFPHWIMTKKGARILEFPISTIRILGKNIPVAGGAYFRIFPYQFTKAGIKSLNNRNRPAIFYLHPWEIDPEHPKLKLPLRISLTHYYNLAGTERKFKKLLQDFRFIPLKKVLEYAK
jgi:polysaccharide deacetylase family protein (PEP-CTERM system associated)